MFDSQEPFALYIHIPFCASRCAYCDFYSTTRATQATAYVEALFALPPLGGGGALTSLYIGGGTPSQLAPAQLLRLFELIRQHYRLQDGAEVTIEANPDDVTEEWIDTLRQTPVGRVSLGLQTFSDPLLRLLRRRHTAAEAVDAVRRLQAAGYTNLSIDLIYGLPGQTLQQWDDDLTAVLALRVPHLSAYALMVEAGTPLYNMVESGRVEVASDELSLDMYRLLCHRLSHAGYEHYEVSNFALPHFRARHNSAYWTGAPYLGLGPGAHSFDGHNVRSWLRPDLDAFLRGDDLRERETLTPQQRYEERVFLALRTSDGLPLHTLTPEERHTLLARAEPHLRSGRLHLADGRLRLTEEAFFIMDTIIVDLI